MPTCLPAVEEHADDLDDSDETEAQEEGETEHVELHVGPVDPHEGPLSDHLGGGEFEGVIDPVLSCCVNQF